MILIHPLYILVVSRHVVETINKQRSYINANVYEYAHTYNACILKLLKLKEMRSIFFFKL